MNIMDDIKIAILGQELEGKMNRILTIFDTGIDIGVRQYKDHYALEFYSKKLKENLVISINGKGLSIKEYYPEMMEFISNNLTH